MLELPENETERFKAFFEKKGVVMPYSIVVYVKGEWSPLTGPSGRLLFQLFAGGKTFEVPAPWEL